MFGCSRRRLEPCSGFDFLRCRSHLDCVYVCRPPPFCSHVWLYVFGCSGCLFGFKLSREIAITRGDLWDLHPSFARDCRGVPTSYHLAFAGMSFR